PQGVPGGFPGPVGGDRFALGSGQPGGDVDQVTAQGGAAGAAVAGAGQGRGRAQQIVRDGRADGPGRVGAEAPRRDVGQRSVDEIGEGGFDDGVVAVGEIGVGGGFGGVGEERVIPPDREQPVGGLGGVFDAAHDQAGGDCPGAGFGHGVGGLGDL